MTTQAIHVRPLESTVRKHFEMRLGDDLADVKICSGTAVDKTAKAEGALAATVGRNIALSSTVPSLDSPQGKLVLAHELIHVSQQRNAHGPLSNITNPVAEKEAQSLASQALEPGPPLPLHRVASQSVMLLTASSGQQSSSLGGQITADLTSPVIEGRVVRFQADIAAGAAFNMAGLVLRNPYDYYLWTVFDRATGAKVGESISITNQASIFYPRIGQFRVECALMDPRRGASPTLTLDQDVVAEDPALAGALATDSDYAEAERELVDDFRVYVQDAAAATGPQGVTARFVAAILREEMANTAVMPTWLGPSNKSYREHEISDVSAALERKAAGSNVAAKDLDKSIGAGQMKLSTAAMVQGLIPWTEQDPQNKQPARTRIFSNFSGLGTSPMAALRDLLAWPKSNIQSVAKSLSMLKNRHNRYPALSRSAFGLNQRASEIIATEYNIGATNSPESSAKASNYGQRIWTYMALPLMKKYFSNS